MVSVKVMGPTRKVAIQRDSQFSSIPMGIEALSDALGSEAYVHLVTFRAKDAINESASKGF